METNLNINVVNSELFPIHYNIQGEILNLRVLIEGVLLAAKNRFSSEIVNTTLILNTAINIKLKKFVMYFPLISFKSGVQILFCYTTPVNYNKVYEVFSDHDALLKIHKR